MRDVYVNCVFQATAVELVQRRTILRLVFTMCMLFVCFRRLQLMMGPQEDYIETVFTCEGDYDDPHLQDRLEDFKKSLKDLLLTGAYHILNNALI